LKTYGKRNKFLLLVPYSYPDYSGSGRNAFNFGKFLVKRGIQVKLITFNRNLEYKKHEQSGGLNIYRIAYLNKNIFLKIVSLLWILPMYILRICTSNIIYVFGRNLIGWQFVILFSNLCSKKVIFRSLIFGEDDVKSLTSQKNYLIRIFHKFLIRRIDCYFSIHPGFSEGYVNVVGNRIRLLELPQGIDTGTFYPVSPEEKRDLRKRLGLPESEFIIISIAFLINRKGFDEIFDQLHYLKIPFQYLIIGENNFSGNHFLSKLQKEALWLKEKGLDLLGARLNLVGPKENINEYIQASDICLFNSKAEGLPNSMLESMACGVPVISNPIAGLEGYLLQHKENSLIFSKLADLDKMIEMLFNDPDMRKSFGVKAHEMIRRIGTFDITLNGILNKLRIEYSKSH
jgi:glycosyltransferase involved in cell wall biosynthesis